MDMVAKCDYCGMPFLVDLEDTNKLFEPLVLFDVVIHFGLTVNQEIKLIINKLKEV